MSGKGDIERPQQIPRSEWDLSWERTFKTPSGSLTPIDKYNRP
jgi:hypothetical protein